MIDRANVSHLWRELEYVDVTQASLLPGLESLANVTKAVCPIQRGRYQKEKYCGKAKGWTKEAGEEISAEESEVTTTPRIPFGQIR